MARKTKEVTDLAVQAPKALAPMEPWELELAEQAKQARANEQAGLPRIVHKNNQILIDGKPVKDNTLRLIILGYNFSKAYYEGRYVPGKTSTPVCYAFASPLEGEKSMRPHEQAPHKQCEQCVGCEHNRFGTAELGRGKRCKDERRVLCVVETNDAASIKKSEVRLLSVPPNSLKNWGAYLDAIKDLSPSGSPSAVVTEISTEAREAAYVLTFKPIARLTGEQGMAVMARGKAENDKLYQAWPEISSEEPQEAAPARSAKTRAKAR